MTMMMMAIIMTVIIMMTIIIMVMTTGTPRTDITEGEMTTIREKMTATEEIRREEITTMGDIEAGRLLQTTID